MQTRFHRALRRLVSAPDEESMADVAMHVVDATDDELASLTRLLADSGAKLRTSGGTVDIASTGGPGSLSTLLAPLYARAMGARVAKIAVPGRPAGGIDVLGALPGFRVMQDIDGATDTFGRCGYLHTGAGTTFCPLDASFFKWRQENGAQAIAALAITSLLSKKVAAGVDRVVLDVRVGAHGNLGTTVAEARANAQRFIAVAELLGVDAICVVSGSVWPPQPWIGRGEALLALHEALTGAAEARLVDHAGQCFEMARLAAGEPAVAVEEIADDVRAAHDAMLEAHGATPFAYQSRVEVVAAQRRAAVVAPRSGVLRVDVAALRSELVGRQLATDPPAGAIFSDPSGVQILREDGAVVAEGDVLVTVRDDLDPDALALRIASSAQVVDSHNPDAFSAWEVIRA